MIDKFFDVLTSNIIILSSYFAILIFYNIFLPNDKYLMYVNLPFGVLVLGFLFFGNKVIFGLIIGYLIYYTLLKNFDLNLYFDNYFLTSIIYIATVPLTLLILNKLKISVGMGLSYKLDRSNTSHVIIIILLSSITFLFLTLFFSLFYELDVNVYFYCVGNFIGGSLLILLLKLIVKIIGYFKINLVI